MLDYFGIFTRGGALLWTLQFTALRHSPLDALNALIRTCLLEERSSDNTFTYIPKTGAHQSLKWTFDNRLGLVFVAVYQKSLSLLYVDELLSLVKAEFTALYQPSVMQYKCFGSKFEELLRKCEARADLVKKGAPLSKRPLAGSSGSKPGGAGSKVAGGGSKPAVRGGASTAAAGSGDGAEGDAEDSGEDGAKEGRAEQAADKAGAQGDSDEGGNAGNEESDKGAAFDLSKLKGSGPRAAKGRPSAPAAGKKETKDKKEEPKRKEKSMRDWNKLGKRSETDKKLDFSDGVPPPDYDPATDLGSATDVTGGRISEIGTDFGASDSDATAGGGRNGGLRALEETEYDQTDEELDQLASSALDPKSKPSGVLGSFLGRLALRVVGSGALTAEDLRPALDDMKKRLMERNVAEEIAASVCASVGRSMEGKQLASFTGVGAMVRRAFEEALSGILNKRQIDVLLDIRKAQEKGKPYVIVFCGVNGVGKSTNLAKIAHWLGQNNIKVTIAACDTFRAGAVEQLKTHCARLRVPLYERGYEKDPAKVAAEAVKAAEKEGRHVVLVDTAGRMQDNEPLMRALSNLIAVNDPQLVLFVGEALVGNDAVDQLTKFSRALQDLAPVASAAGGARPATRRGIDGIVLTKFDTIDDKVGAALSMVYSSGAPIMFVGCGQTYQDLKKLNVKSVVHSLLK